MARHGGVTVGSRSTTLLCDYDRTRFQPTTCNGDSVAIGWPGARGRLLHSQCSFSMLILNAHSSMLIHQCPFINAHSSMLIHQCSFINAHSSMSIHLCSFINEHSSMSNHQ